MLLGPLLLFPRPLCAANAHGALYQLPPRQLLGGGGGSFAGSESGFSKASQTMEKRHTKYDNLIWRVTKPKRLFRLVS
jgi:hypothetical protein